MEKGYQIKGEGFGENAPKFISFKPAGYVKFIRGSHRTLGRGNTKEEIVERIRKQTESRPNGGQNKKLSRLKTGDSFPSPRRNLTGIQDLKTGWNLKTCESLWQLLQVSELTRI